MRPRFSLQALLVASIIALSTTVLTGHMPGQLVDLRAFYCAGQAQLAGVDPYREHPLHECEQRVSAPGVPPLDYGATMPAPFPGFVLTLFAALARLPFGWALLIWEGGACVALGVAVVLVARTTRTSVTASAIVLGFPAIVLALQLGQVTPFVLLAAAGSAALLQSRRPRLAALAALGALLDPHVGLALVVGIFVCVPRARGVLIAGTAALIALGSLMSGPLREWEYARLVVPAHALANLTEARQFSASNFAFELGVPAALALSLGTLWYAAALAAGSWVALRLRGRLGVAAVAYVPTAFAVFGGTHTHLWQLALAVPAFMLLSSAAPGRRHAAYHTAAFVAAMPWLYIAPFPWLFGVPAGLAVLYAREVGIGRQAFRLAAGSLVGLTGMMISILRLRHIRKLVSVHVLGNPLAEVSWRLFTVNRNVPPDGWFFVARAPTAIAFAVLLVAFVQAALAQNPNLDAPMPSEQSDTHPVLGAAAVTETAVARAC